MKKTLLSATTLLIAAGSAVPALAQFTVSLGAQSTQLFVESDIDFNTNFLQSNDNPQAVINADSGADNQETEVGGEIALGYQYNIDNTFNVALEIFGQLAGASVDTPIWSKGSDVLTSFLGIPAQDADASFNWITGLRLRPGIYITPKTRLFIDGGIVAGNFELKQDDATVNYFETNFNTNFDETQQETLFGWRYGAGVEYQFNDTFVMGVDYTLTQFNQMTSDFIEDVATAINEQVALDGKFFHWSGEYVPTLETLGLNFKFLIGGAKKKHGPPPMRVYPLRDK